MIAPYSPATKFVIAKKKKKQKNFDLLKIDQNALTTLLHSANEVFHRFKLQADLQLRCVKRLSNITIYLHKMDDSDDDDSDDNGENDT